MYHHHSNLHINQFLRHALTEFVLFCFRNSVDREALGNLYAVLSRLSVDVHHLTEEMDSQEEEGSLCHKLTAECFRAHRNACVQCTGNQCCLR